MKKTFSLCESCSETDIAIGDILSIDRWKEIPFCSSCGFSTDGTIGATMQLECEELPSEIDENDRSLARFVSDYRILEPARMS